MKRLGWGLFLVGGALLLISTPSLAVMHVRCANSTACAGNATNCRIEQICWTIWEFDPVSDFVTDPITDRPGVGVPRWTPPDEDADAVVDCWKDVTIGAYNSSGFPYRNNPPTESHNGVDITSSAPNHGRGAPVGSLGAGYVTEGNFSKENGNFVRVAQGDGNTVTYIHLLSYTVSLGDELAAGEMLGRMNCTGYCGGRPGDAKYQDIDQTHVHIQVLKTNDSSTYLDAVELYGGENCSAKVPGGPTPPVPGLPGQQCPFAPASLSDVPRDSPKQRHCP